jgi:hypothetical protein
MPEIVEIPIELTRFQLPQAVQARLQFLLDRQDEGYVSGRTTGSRRTCGTGGIFISSAFAIDTGNQASIDGKDSSFPVDIRAEEELLGRHPPP